MNRTQAEQTTDNGKVVIGDIELSFAGNDLDGIAKKQTDVYYKSFHGTNKLGGHVGELAVATSSAIKKVDTESKLNAGAAKEAKDKAIEAKEVAEAAKNAAEEAEKRIGLLGATKLESNVFAEFRGRDEQIREQVKENKQTCSTHGQEIASLKTQVVNLKEDLKSLSKAQKLTDKDGQEIASLKTQVVNLKEDLKSLSKAQKSTDKTLQKLVGRMEVLILPQTMPRSRHLSRANINGNIESCFGHNWHTNPSASSEVNFGETASSCKILNEDIRSPSKASTINDRDEKITNLLASSHQAQSEVDASETASSFDVLEENPSTSINEEVKLEPVLTQSFSKANS